MPREALKDTVMTVTLTGPSPSCRPTALVSAAPRPAADRRPPPPGISAPPSIPGPGRRPPMRHIGRWRHVSLAAPMRHGPWHGSGPRGPAEFARPLPPAAACPRAQAKRFTRQSYDRRRRTVTFAVHSVTQRSPSRSGLCPLYPSQILEWQ